MLNYNVTINYTATASYDIRADSMRQAKEAAEAEFSADHHDCYTILDTTITEEQ